MLPLLQEGMSVPRKCPTVNGAYLKNRKDNNSENIQFHADLADVRAVIRDILIKHADLADHVIGQNTLLQEGVPKHGFSLLFSIVIERQD